MTKKTIIKYAFAHAIGAAIYIALVVAFISNAERIFGQTGDNNPLNTMVFLLILVISAAVMGLLIFARPIMWYLDGIKKEAVALAIYTIGFLVLIAAVIVSILILI